jgi:hypothetical protein
LKTKTKSTATKTMFPMEGNRIAEIAFVLDEAIRPSLTVA